MNEQPRIEPFGRMMPGEYPWEVQRKRKKADKRNLYFVFYLFAMVAVLAFKYLFSPSLPVDYVTAAFAVLGVFLQPAQMISVMVFTIPFVSILKTGILNLVLIVFFILKTFVFKRRKIRISELGMIFFFLALWELAHLMFQPFSFVEYIKVFSAYFLIMLVSGYDFTKEESTIAIRSYICGALSFSVLLFLYEFTHNGGSISKYLLSFSRFGTITNDIELEATYKSVYANPNFISLYSGVAIACVLFLLIRDRRRAIQYVEIVALLFFGFLTQSKTFIIGVVVIVALTILSSLKPGYLKRAFWVVFGIAALILLVFLINRDFFTQMYEVIFNRFEEGGMSSRDDLFMTYLRYSMDNPRVLFFGVGIQGLNQKVGISHNPHSMIIEVLTSWGLVGIVALVFLVYQFYKKSGGRIFDFANLPFWTLFVMTQASRLFKYQHTVLFFLLLLAVINVNQKNLAPQVPVKEESKEKEEPFRNV